MVPAAFRFADFVLDPQRRELRRDGTPVPVERRVFDLIAFLIEHRDRAVSKDEIQEAVWAGRVVSETALTRAIMKARRALGDDSGTQSMIRTVHGHGYRFVAALAPDGAPLTEAEPSQAATRRVGVLLLLIALVALAVLLVIRAPGSSELKVAVLPVSDQTGDVELAWTRLGLMGYANRLLAEMLGRQPVASTRVLEAAEDSAPGDLEQLRARLDATHLVAAELAAAGQDLVLTWRIAHADGVTPSVRIEGRDVTAMARRMISDIVTRLPGTGLRRQFRTVSDDAFVNEAYARGLSLQYQGDIAQAREFFEVAVTQAPELFWPSYELALTQRDMGELDAAADRLAGLLQHPQAERDAYRRIAVNLALGQVEWRRGKLESARGHYLTAVERAVADNDSRSELLARVNLGILLRQLDELDEARDQLTLALALAQRQGHGVPGSIYQSLGHIERREDRLELALDYYRRAFDEFQSRGHLGHSAIARMAMGRIHHRQGRFEEAREALTASLNTLAQSGDFFARLGIHEALCRLYRDAEMWSQARMHANTLLALAEEADNRSGIVDALAERIRLALLQDRPEDALEDLERWRTLLDASNPPARYEVLSAWAHLTAGSPGARDRLATYADSTSSASARLEALTALGVAASNPGERQRWLQRAIREAEDEQQLSLAMVLRARIVRELIAREAIGQAREWLAVGAADDPGWPTIDGLRAELSAVNAPADEQAGP